MRSWPRDGISLAMQHRSRAPEHALRGYDVALCLESGTWAYQCKAETLSSRGRAGSARKLKWSRSGAGASGGAHASWQGTIDELAKAPSARLFPFVKVQPPSAAVAAWAMRCMHQPSSPADMCAVGGTCHRH